MEDWSILPILVAALVPTITGMIWYHPKVMGSAWMSSTGKTEEQLREGFNMPLVMIISLVGSFLLSFVTNAITEFSHKSCDEAGEVIFNSHHTFGHGMFHGAIYAILIIGPPMVMNAMYERRSWKNTFVHMAYWIITVTLMVGITDAWN